MDATIVVMNDSGRMYRLKASAFHQLMNMSRGIVLVWNVALVLACAKDEPARSYPVLGRAPVFAVSRGEEAGEKIQRWTAEGLRGATVIHISAESGLGPVQGLREGIPGFQDAAVHARNFLHVGYELGIVGKVFWVVPWEYWTSSGAGERTKDLLRSQAGFFRDEDIQAMAMKEGCLAGSLNDVPVSICPPFGMPFIRDPVVLNVDVGIFPVYARERSQSALRGLKEFFDTMALRDYRVVSVHVGENRGDPDPGPVFRHLGEEFVEMITNPERAMAEAPPELWTVRDTAANMLSGGEDERVLEYLEAEGAAFVEDPTLRSAQSLALVSLGRYDEADTVARKLCEEATEYCDIFFLLARWADERNDDAATEKFFRAALGIREGWPEAERRLGLFLFEQERFEEAGRRFRAAVRGGETPEDRIRLGDLAFEGGQTKEAAGEYGRALELYRQGMAVDASPRNLKSLERMLRVFEETGKAEDLVAARALGRRLGSVESR